MKLLVLILVLAIAIKTSKAEPCGFCPNGVEFPDEEVYDDDTKVTFKCSSLGVIAMSLEDDDETCENMKYATEICCPSQFLPCSFCPSGVVDANTTVPESNGNTCGSLAAAAATIPDSLQVCNEIKMLRDSAACGSRVAFDRGCQSRQHCQPRPQLQCARTACRRPSSIIGSKDS